MVIGGFSWFGARVARPRNTCEELATIPELFSVTLRRVNTRLDDALPLSTSQQTTNGAVISSSNGIQSKQSRLFIETGLAKRHGDLIKLERK